MLRLSGRLVILPLVTYGVFYYWAARFESKFALVLPNLVFFCKSRKKKSIKLVCAANNKVPG